MARDGDRSAYTTPSKPWNCADGLQSYGGLGSDHRITYRMAIFWPTGTQEQVRAGEALRRALSSAVTLIGGGAGILALDDTGVRRKREAASRNAMAR